MHSYKYKRFKKKHDAIWVGKGWGRRGRRRQDRHTYDYKRYKKEQMQYE